MTTVIEEFVARLGWDVDSTQLQKFQARTQNLGTFFKRTFQVGAAGLTAFGFGLSKVMNEFSKVENAEANFTPLMGSVEKATKLVDALVKTAATTPFQFEAIADAAQQLLPIMNGDIAKTVKTFRMMGDAAGGNVEKLKGITLGYTKAMLKGKVDMESLNIIGEKGVPILNELRKLYGDMGADLYEMSRKGKISLNDLERVFEQMTSKGGLFYKGMDIASQTLTGRISTLKDTLSMVAVAIGRQLAPYLKSVVDEFIKFAEQTEKWVKKNSKKVGDSLLGIIRGLVSGIKQLVGLIGFLGNVIQKVGGLGNAFKILFGILFGFKFVPFLVSLNQVLAAAGALGPGLKAAATAAGASWGPIAALFALTALLADDIVTTLSGGKSLGGKLDEKLGISKFLHELPLKFGMARDEFDKFNLKLVEFVEETLPEFGSAVWNALGSGIDFIVSGWQKIGGAISWVFDKLTSLVKLVGQFLPVGQIAKLIGGVTETAPRAAAAAKEKGSEFLKSETGSRVMAAGKELLRQSPLGLGYSMTPNLIEGNQLLQSARLLGASAQRGGVAFNTPVNVVVTNAKATPAEIEAAAKTGVEKALKKTARNYAR